MKELFQKTKAWIIRAYKTLITLSFLAGLSFQAYIVILVMHDGTAYQALPYRYRSAIEILHEIDKTGSKTLTLSQEQVTFLEQMEKSNQLLPEEIDLELPIVYGSPVSKLEEIVNLETSLVTENDEAITISIHPKIHLGHFHTLMKRMTWGHSSDFYLNGSRSILQSLLAYLPALILVLFGIWSRQFFKK